MAGDREHNGSSKRDPDSSSVNKSHKRKRDLDGAPVASTPTPTKKSKKAQSPSSTPTPSKENRKKKRRSEAADSDQEEPARKESPVPSSSRKATSSNKDDEKAKKKKKSKDSKRKSREDDVDSSELATNINETNDDEEPETTNQEDAMDIDSKAEDGPKAAKNKFSGIMSKFERSAKLQKAAKTKEQDEEEDEGPTAEPVYAQGLEPLPQPEDVPQVEEMPTYSSLPPWLANPVRASAEERKNFSDLGIESNLLRVLENNGYKEAFAVQSTVIPLLLQGPKNHPGDLCISAATGSGKTLSYVLPLVTSLEPTPAPRLRGIIVVPTRELVKQAREATELCAAGSGLHVASAVGNVAIKDEQRSLIRVDQVYGPESFKKRQNIKLGDQDWTNFSLQDYISDAGDQGESLPGYVHKSEPNVDILICTPGRLVDHIRYTKGFTLKHLEWLVIDEADRLLNESFQEWVDVVMNSLDERKATEALGFSGKFMSELGLPIQSTDPRKVILSATMTRDITKLNSLRLSNPQMVLVGSGEAAADDEEGKADHPDDRFNLPLKLKEYSVSVGDGSKKPLHLLRLLLSHIKVGGEKSKRALPDTSASSDSDTSSSGESDSDDTSSDESSSDDSDSESDSDDDTSSDGSSSDDSDSESDSDSDDTSSDESDSDSSDSEDKPADKKPAGPAQTSVLIFTKSSESASRLSRLLSLLDPSLASQIGTIIKSNKSSASRKTLTAYRHGKVSIIIATDRASRGLDLESLSDVVNYDVPSSITTYVHRVGRTARAGKEGSAWTLVAHREGRWFMNEIAKGSDGKITRSTKVERVNVKLDNMGDIKSRYGKALEALEEEVKTGGIVKSSKTKQ